MSNLIFAFIKPLFLYILMQRASYKQGTIRLEFNRIIGECGKGYLGIILTKILTCLGHDVKGEFRSHQKIHTEKKDLYLRRISYNDKIKI